MKITNEGFIWWEKDNREQAISGRITEIEPRIKDGKPFISKNGLKMYKVTFEPDYYTQYGELYLQITEKMLPYYELYAEGTFKYVQGRLYFNRGEFENTEIHKEDTQSTHDSQSSQTSLISFMSEDKELLTFANEKIEELETELRLWQKLRDFL